jgi:glucose/arabinose dehydrogenase
MVDHVTCSEKSIARLEYRSACRDRKICYTMKATPMDIIVSTTAFDGFAGLIMMGRQKMLALLLGSLLAALLQGNTGSTAPVSDFVVKRVASGLSRPVFATAPPGDRKRLFIVEQFDAEQLPATGRIRILDLSSFSLKAKPFLEIRDVSQRNEGGLLGLAFHPDYASNGFFYVYFQRGSGDAKDTLIRRYSVSSDPDIADNESGQPVIEFDQPQGNHNGGWLAFAPDGYLYISLGDGGGANDSGSGHTVGVGNAQDRTNFFGSIIRIDVDGDDFPDDSTRNYAIPPDNPLVGRPGKDEIFVYGLRNAFRNSFDRATGDLYIGDVGQGLTEEINVLPSGMSGINFGWRLREGTSETPAVGGPQPLGGIQPIYEYGHGVGEFEGASVIGGYVYRGPVPSLQGRYFFADYVNPRIWSLRWNGSDPDRNDGENFRELKDHTETAAFAEAGSIDQPASFAEDDLGNLYIIDLDGDVFLISGLSETR